MRFGRVARAIVAAMLGAAILGPGTVVHGAKPVGGDDAYYVHVARRIEQVGRAGGDGAAIDRMLEREFGWRKVAGGGAADGPIALGTPSGSDVVLYRPSIYRNTQAGRYEATASWQWKKCGSLSCWSANYGDALGNDGGPDGFGIVSTVAVNFNSTFFATWTERNALKTYTNPDDFDQYGTGFSEQDRRYHTHDYTWDHGLVMYGFNIRTCVGMKGTPWIFKSRMSHTWGNTGVASMSLAAGAISFSFSNSSSPSKWSIYGPQPLAWYPCG
jgi:hypothetical protein